MSLVNVTLSGTLTVSAVSDTTAGISARAPTATVKPTVFPIRITPSPSPRLSNGSDKNRQDNKGTPPNPDQSTDSRGSARRIHTGKTKNAAICSGHLLYTAAAARGRNDAV